MFTSLGVLGIKDRKNYWPDALQEQHLTHYQSDKNNWAINKGYFF